MSCFGPDLRIGAAIPVSVWLQGEIHRFTQKKGMTRMQLSTAQISIIQDIETRRLKAYHGRAYLWSKTPRDPACADEVAEFYTVSLLRFIEVVGASSAHQRLELIVRSEQGSAPSKNAKSSGFLGEYPNAQ